jgi:3-dehydrosphinganine reductase
MSKDSFTGKLVIVTGGSKGIGKATAKRIGELGGSVCIVARGKKALTEAAEEIKSVQTGEGQFVETIAADCADMDQLSPRLNEFIDKYRVPDYLINCAGYTYPQYVEKLILDDFKKNMDVNYYAQLVPTLILLPHLIERRSGYVANISSLAGLFGIMGYACYSPTKFALVGLTDTLRHELRPYNIHFSVVCPSDVMTPGYEVENQTKPQECLVLSEGIPIMEPEEVANDIVDGILKNEFLIIPGDGGKLAWAAYVADPEGFRAELDAGLVEARERLGKNG